MTKGVKLSKGLLAWADEIGISGVSKTEQLYSEYHEYRCSQSC
jgi:hypothetical protein